MNHFPKILLLVLLIWLFNSCQRHWGEYINAPKMDYNSLEQAPFKVQVNQTHVVLSGEIWMDNMPKVGPGPFKNLHITWRLTTEDLTNNKMPPVTPRLLWVVCDSTIYLTPIREIQGQVALNGYCACGGTGFIVIQFIYQERPYFIRTPGLTITCTE